MSTRIRVSKGSKRVPPPLSVSTTSTTTILPASNGAHALALATPMTPPGSMRRIHDKRTTAMNMVDMMDDDEDQMMRNRASLDSNASTILGDDEDAFEDEYLWTDDQIAIIVRTLEEGNPPSVTEWTPPTTPYVLPFLPTNLVDLWARQLKRSTDWPHSVRAIRSKLRSMARTVAKSMHTNVFSEQAEDTRVNPDTRANPDDDLIISPTLEGPIGRRDDSAVYKSSLRVQQNENVLPITFQYHPFTWSRPRSPAKTPRSPSEEPISPVDSYFPSTSPRHPALRNRSRSISPFPAIRDSNTMDHDGTPPPVPPKDGVPSLSPMKLSPKKGERNARSPDPSDLLALFPPRASHARPPIPMMFTREEMRPGSELQNQAQRQARGQSSHHLQVDNFFSSGTTDEASTPNTISTGTDHTPYSSISSISSLISAHSAASTADSIASLGGPIVQHQQALHRQPSLPQGALSSLRTHLSEFTDRRGGIKRSSSFSKPRDPIKRAPSYGNIKELPNPREMIFAKTSNLSSSTATIRDNSDVLMETQATPLSSLVILSGHKRERSDSSNESSQYDTEDIPPSSAPSSGLISQRSPVKATYETPPKPLPGSPLKAAFDPEKVFTPSPSPTKMLDAPAPPQSMTKRLLGSFTRRKSFKKDKNGGSGRETTASSLSPSPGPSLVLHTSPLFPISLTLSPGSLDVPASPTSTIPPISPISSGFPVSPIASRFPDGLSPDMMDVDDTPTQLPHSNSLGLRGSEDRFTTPDSPGYGLATSSEAGGRRYRRASASAQGGRVSRKPSFEPRREGEPRRKRVKTDELATPPRELPDIGSPYETRYAPRARSPTAFSEGMIRSKTTTTSRISRTRSNVPKTPPGRRTPKSPRLLAGAARKNSITQTSPLPPMLVLPPAPPGKAANINSSPATTTASTANNATPTPANVTITPTQTRRPTSFLTSRTSSSSTVTAATAASKARQTTAIRPSSMSTTRNAPKREPSFLNAPLLPAAAKARAEEQQQREQQQQQQKGKEVKETGSMKRVGTTRYPTISTASISSVLFPGGAPMNTSSSILEGVPESAPAHITQFELGPGLGALGTGEESVIRAGESAAQARRSNIKGKGSLRGALGGGVTRTRMARSVSMLGPGERPAPY